MSKEEGVRTVVIGGQADTTQQYCGTVGGQSTDFSTIDSEIKVFKPSVLPTLSNVPWFITLDNAPQKQFSCPT